MATNDPDFSLEANHVDEVLRVVMAGTISERTVLGPLPDRASQITINLAAVHRINSTGVRTWMRFIAALDARGVPVVLESLSPVLVAQASMIASFLGSARVESFLVPYSCDACDHEMMREFRLGAEVPDHAPCSSCAAAAEIDADRNVFDALRNRASLA